MKVQKEIVLLYFLTIFLVLTLVALWEFELEDPLSRFFGMNGGRAESSEIHWEYVRVVTIFCAIALLFPFIAALKLEQDRSEAVEKLQEREVFYRTLIENSSDITFIVDEEGTIIYSSPSVVERLGYSINHLLGRPMEAFLHSLDAPEFMAQLQKALTTNDAINTHRGSRFVHHNGEMIFLESLFTRMVDSKEGQKKIVISSRDVTERVIQEEKIRFLAFHDPLTGLPNRSTFGDRLELEIAHAERNNLKGAVLFLDLDNFKEINDTLGHDVGDELLKVIAKLLKASLRKEDTVSRLGGDEFTCLLPEIKEMGDVEIIALKLREAFDVPIPLAGKKVFVKFSVGGSVFPDHGCTTEELVKKADNAMYRAKEEGKNRFRLYS